MAVWVFVNGAAIWFLLKAIEVLVLFWSDAGSALGRLLDITRLSDTTEEDVDAPFYDSSRGKLEYVISGGGFADFRTARASKKWFLISTLLPLLIFTTELLSIYLGFERHVCDTSSNPWSIWAPSLVLFGGGRRITRVEDYSDLKMLEEDYGTPFGEPCSTWSSKRYGVAYSAEICGETASIAAHVNAAAPELVVPRNKTGTMDKRPALEKHIATMIPTTLGKTASYSISVYEVKSRESTDDLVELGSIRFLWQVLVGGRNILYRNATTKGIVSSQWKKQFRLNLEHLDHLHRVSNAQPVEGRPEYWENEDMFGFRWNLETYMTRVGLLMTYALLGQATKDAVRTAIEMSPLNNIRGLFQPHRLTDTLVFCKDELMLPPGFSICIIVASVVFRLLLSCFRRPVSSPEFALVTAGEIAKSQESSVFFMDRRRVVHIENIKQWGFQPCRIYIRRRGGQ